MSELSKKAGQAAGAAARGVTVFARSAANTTRRLSRIAKLNLDLSEEWKNVKRLYVDVGRLYYEAHRDDPEGFFVQLFQQLDASMAEIEAMEAELKALKAEKAPADADFEAVPEEEAITVEIEVGPADEPEAAGEPEPAEAPEDPVAEEPPADEPAAEEPAVEEPAPEEPAAEEPAPAEE